MKRLAALLAALALLGLAGWYVHRNTTWKVEKVHTGFKPEARRNPMLAAEFLLERLGRHPVPRVGLPGPAEGLKPADTLVMVDRQRGFTPQEADRLLAFARGGGQLVIEMDATQGLLDAPGNEGPVPGKVRSGKEAPRKALALRDHLLERLGAEVVAVPWKAQKNGAEEEEDEDAAELRHRKLWEPQLRLDDGEPYTVRISPRWRLVDKGLNDFRPLGSHKGLVGLEYPVGAGRVRIFVDLDAWRNSALVKLDHAAFLAWILVDRPPEGRTWLVRGERTASLLDWLKANAWAALGSLTVLAALVAWRGFARFGPVLPVPELARRSLLEHVDASGRLLWAEGQGSRMLRAARAALMKRIERAHPAWAHLPLPVLSSRLADFADLPEPEVRRALFDDHPPDAASFKDAIRTLERLRRSL